MPRNLVSNRFLCHGYWPIVLSTFANLFTFIFVFARPDLFTQINNHMSYFPKKTNRLNKASNCLGIYAARCTFDWPMYLVEHHLRH